MVRALPLIPITFGPLLLYRFAPLKGEFPTFFHCDTSLLPIEFTFKNYIIILEKICKGKIVTVL